MKIERDSEGFSDAFLTNQQLSRSIGLFLDLRSECNCLFDQLLNTKDKLSGQLPTSKLLNILKLNGRE
jgi:hypothetical protein